MILRELMATHKHEYEWEEGEEYCETCGFSKSEIAIREERDAYREALLKDASEYVLDGGHSCEWRIRFEAMRSRAKELLSRFPRKES